MTERTKAIQPFDRILCQIQGGQLVDELTDELTAVLAAVQETGKTGSITLSLKITPQGGMNEQALITPSVKGTKPEKPRPWAIFFINQDHGLQRDDPYQETIPGLTPVSEATNARNLNHGE